MNNFLSPSEGWSQSWQGDGEEAHHLKRDIAADRPTREPTVWTTSARLTHAATYRSDRTSLHSTNRLQLLNRSSTFYFIWTNFGLCPFRFHVKRFMTSWTTSWCQTAISLTASSSLTPQTGRARYDWQLSTLHGSFCDGTYCELSAVDFGWWFTYVTLFLSFCVSMYLRCYRITVFLLCVRAPQLTYRLRSAPSSLAYRDCESDT